MLAAVAAMGAELDQLMADREERLRVHKRLMAYAEENLPPEIVAKLNVVCVGEPVKACPHASICDQEGECTSGCTQRLGVNHGA